MPDSNENPINTRLNLILEKFETMSVPIESTEFSIEEYRKAFPQGIVSTPIGEVKIGKNQFYKLAEKDKGNRKILIGAMKQTLFDPIVIIPEKNDNREAYIFMKSFRKNEKLSIIVSVVVSIGNDKIAISTYKRKRREIISKIKKAGVITYEKGNGTSQTNGIYPPL
jgi:hypothetical protein